MTHYRTEPENEDAPQPPWKVVCIFQIPHKEGLNRRMVEEEAWRMFQEDAGVTTLEYVEAKQVIGKGDDPYTNLMQEIRQAQSPEELHELWDHIHQLQDADQHYQALEQYKGRMRVLQDAGDDIKRAEEGLKDEQD